MSTRVKFKDLLVGEDRLMDEFKRKPWDAVTVSAWIPARLCTKLDLLALRLRLTRNEALGLFLSVVLQSNGLMTDVERLLTYQQRVNETFLLRGSRRVCLKFVTLMNRWGSLRRKNRKGKIRSNRLTTVLKSL